MSRTHWLAVAALVVSSSVLEAQVPDSGRGVQPSRGGGALGARGRAGQPPRRALEANVQRAMATAIRSQLNLGEQKMQQLQQANGKYENERRALLHEERQARQTLKTGIEDSTSTDQSKIEAAMARMIQIQRRRVDLLEAEQKDLSTFLTPRQRAQFFALRERIARRLLELEQGGPPGGGRRGSPRN